MVFFLLFKFTFNPPEGALFLNQSAGVLIATKIRNEKKTTRISTLVLFSAEGDCSGFVFLLFLLDGRYTITSFCA